MEHDYLDLNMISFEWLERTSDPKLLKRALKLLKDDGDYFPDLAKAIDEKLQSVDEKYKKRKQNENITLEDIQKCKDEIAKFESELKQNDKIIKDLHQDSSSNNNYNVILLQKKKEAENEKIKGNELMKTKEYHDAVIYYTNSIDIYEYEPTTYCNRALAYIQLKQYNKALDDCDKAIALKDDYVKAYYRRYLCLSSLNKFDEAFEDLLYVLNDNPQSQDIMKQMEQLKKNWKKGEGDSKWAFIENDLEKKINLAKKGKYKVKEEKQVIKEEKVKNEGVKINISETKEEDGDKGNKKENEGNGSESNKKEGYKKIQIVEEDDE